MVDTFIVTIVVGMINSIHPSTPRSAFASATVADEMSAGVINCTPQTPLREVARLMATYKVHAVFVFDYGDEEDETIELWGLVSDLDLVAGAWAGVDERTAGESAVAPLVTVRSRDRLEHAAQLMAENGVSHLAVIDDATGRPVGVLSSLDIARAVADVSRGADPWHALPSYEHVLR